MDMMCSNSYCQVSTLSSADRFIPRRRGVNLEASNFLLNRKPSPLRDVKPVGTTRYVNYAHSTWKRKLYQERLWAAVNPYPEKILNFSDALVPKKKKPTATINYPLWPVKARRKPLIGIPSLVLDMPNLEANICHHATDWSRDSHLASVYEREIFLWHPDSNIPYQLSNTGRKVEKCVCWNQSSTHFAFAVVNSRIGVWELSTNKVSGETVCLCGASTCTVTSIAWTSASRIVAGCSFGRLTVWSSNLSLLKTVESAHRGTIITITLSCSEQYLASSATDGFVRVWLWPSLKLLFEISYTSPVRGIAWHPFKESLLAVGGNIGEGSLTLWNCSSYKRIGYKPPPNEYCFIDNLTFSSLTGELVVSYWQQGDSQNDNYGNSFVDILSNLDRKVDAIEWHGDRILYLMWGANGTQLGTAGADESLCIWDFLGTSPSITKSYKKDHQIKTIDTILFDSLSSFGYCIR